jgi:poly(3-hydroxybutyrate) depolymerase
VPKSVSSPDYLYGSDVYAQAADSDAWATAYTGSISKVATLERHVDILDARLSKAIYDFLTEYVSYDNITAYGNHLAPRAEYGEIGTMLVNGQIREFQIYVPDSAATLWPKGAPVIFVWAGNTQTDQVFFHNTLWWKVADEEGVILAIPCETYSRSSTSVSHADTGMFYETLAEYLIKYYNVDPTRFYSTGQSAGSFASQGFGITNPEYFAAIASTSGLSYPDDGQSSGPGRVPPEDATHEMIPTYCIIGEGDIEFMTGTLWDDTENMLDKWATYYLEANGIGPLGDGSNVEVDGRYTTWTWNNEQGFPLFKVTRTSHRAHNCIPAEMPILWDYMKHWSYKDGVRYYDGTSVTK